MNNKLGADLVRFRHIFDGNMFSIPDYQRGYAWNRDQVLDLLKDIEHMWGQKGDATRHYTGALIISQEKENARYQVIDGQQRLMTLVIMMHCVTERVHDGRERARIEKQYVRRGSVGDVELVLEPGSENLEYFRDVVVGTESESQYPPRVASHQRMLDARRCISEWLDRHCGTEEKSLRELLCIAEERLGLLVYLAGNESEAGAMFEVINNRGRPLTELEKLKNYFIYLSLKLGAVRTRKTINERWGELLRNFWQAGVSSEWEETGIVKAAAVVYFRLGKKESGDLYTVVKEKRLSLDDILSDPDKTGSRKAATTEMEGFIKFLIQCSDWYRKIYSSNRTGVVSNLIPVFERLRAQGQHANVLPLLFSILTKHGTSEKEQGQLMHLLDLVEKVNFRVYVARNSWRSDWGQGPLYEVAGRYWYGDSLLDLLNVNKGASQSLSEQLENWLVYFTIVDAGATDQLLKESLTLREDEQYDFYHWSGLKYFLMCCEANKQPYRTIRVDKILGARNSMKSGDYFSIEHVWATSHEAEKYSTPRDMWIRRSLGNFVLLELNLNIIGRNRDIVTKMDLYEKGDRDNHVQPTVLAQVLELVDIGRGAVESVGKKALTDGRCFGYRNVHYQICQAREKEFIAFAEKEWSLNEFKGYGEAMSAVGAA